MNHWVFLLLFALTSCMNNDLGPEASLKDFVDARVGKVVDRDFVLERLTGKMLQSFKMMSAENFEKYADMKDIKSDSLKILSKSCLEKKCFITYSISYLTKSGSKVQFASQVEKVAEMIEGEDRWLIADVNNIKTYHESLEPLNVSDDKK